MCPSESLFNETKWASSREILSSGFATRIDSNRPAQPQKQARGWKFWMYKQEILYYPGNEQQRRLISTFVVRIWHKQVFTWLGPNIYTTIFVIFLDGIPAIVLGAPTSVRKNMNRMHLFTTYYRAWRFANYRWICIIPLDRYRLAKCAYEPRHEKTWLCHMRITKAQISLRVGTVWSAPLLFAA